MSHRRVSQVLTHAIDVLSSCTFETALITKLQCLGIQAGWQPSGLRLSWLRQCRWLLLLLRRSAPACRAAASAVRGPQRSCIWTALPHDSWQQCRRWPDARPLGGGWLQPYYYYLSQLGQRPPRPAQPPPSARAASHAMRLSNQLCMDGASPKHDAYAHPRGARSRQITKCMYLCSNTRDVPQVPHDAWPWECPHGRLQCACLSHMYVPRLHPPPFRPSRVRCLHRQHTAHHPTWFQKNPRQLAAAACCGLLAATELQFASCPAAG